MTFKTFQETLPWEKTQHFLLASQQAFSKLEDNWLKEEFMQTACKAAVQVAEGHERYNNAEQIKYLGYAKDNLVKCRALIALATQLTLLDEENCRILEEKAIDASKVIYGLRKYLQKKAAAA